VTVSIFGQSYRIRTDDPDLVFRLARRVLGAVREVMGRDPGRPAASGADALIQATFRLAMRLHSAEREAGALRAQSEALESRIERLLDLLGRDP
jgi:cell division protein ZapA (FtsZ GTPase activity inhibitor)